jgi:hypothetical protein
MPRRLVKFLHLPWQDKVLAAEAAFALVALKVGLRVGGMRACTTLMGSARPRRGAPPSPEELARVGLAVKRAASPVGLTCLPQSLAVMWLLRRRGIAAELRFGAKLGAGSLDAHAWVAVPDLGWTFDLSPTGGYAPLQEGSIG